MKGLKRIGIAGVLWMVSGLMLHTAQGGVIAQINETFNHADLVGQVPTGWTVASKGANTGADLRSIQELDVDVYALRFTRTNTTATPPGGAASSSGTAYFTGSTGSVVNGQIQDIEGSVEFRRSAGDGTRLGVIVRGGSTSWNPGTGYFIGFAMGHLSIWSGASADLNLHTLAASWADVLPETRKAEVSVAISPNLSTTDFYRLDFSAIGSTLSASLWTTDATPVELASITWEDSTFTGPGSFGLRFEFENTTAGAWARNLEGSVIPEPGSVALLTLGMAATALLRRRTR